MVRGIRDGVGDRLKLRIDPNMGYTPGGRRVAGPRPGEVQPRILRAADAL